MSIASNRPANQPGRSGLPPIPGEAPTIGPENESFHFFEVLLNEENSHPSSKAFYDKLIAAGLLHERKQRDYGKKTDPFANVRSTEEFGVPAWVGCMIRLNDKVKRLQSLARTGTLHNEAARDSFMDIAVYALIAGVLYDEGEA